MKIIVFLIQIPLRLIPKNPIDHKPALIEIIDSHKIGDKPLSEPMMVEFTEVYKRLPASMS